MSLFKFGEYVVYSGVYRKYEIGRVTYDDGMFTSVCFSDGCIESNTPRRFLRRATKHEIEIASKNIGYHRFDEFCLDRNDECCFMCGARVVSE